MHAVPADMLGSCLSVLTRVGLRGRGAAVGSEGDGTGDGLRGGNSARMKEWVVTGVSLERLGEKGLWVVCPSDLV